jgi:hypothetical protein
MTPGDCAFISVIAFVFGLGVGAGMVLYRGEAK